MIKNLDTQQFARFSKPSCDGSVVAAGHSGTGRMIVGQHDGDRTGQHGTLKYFSWGNRGRVGGTDGHDRVGSDLILSIKVKSDEVLPAVVRQN